MRGRESYAKSRPSRLRENANSTYNEQKKTLIDMIEQEDSFRCTGKLGILSCA